MNDYQSHVIQAIKHIWSSNYASNTISYFRWPRTQRRKTIKHPYAISFWCFSISSLIWWYLYSFFACCKQKKIYLLPFFFSIKKKKEKCSHPYWPILRENALDEEIIFFPLNRISQQQRNLVVFFSSETIFQNSWVSLPTLISTCIREVYNDPYDANIDSRKEQDKVEFFLKSQI